MLKNYLIILAVFLVIDIPMITLINSNMYQLQLERINKGPMDIGYKMLHGTVVTYLLLAYGLYYHIIKPEVEKKEYSKTDIVMKSAAFGIVVFGVYNYTNLATINEYGQMEAMYDTLWGATLCGLVSTFYLNIMI